MREVDGSVEVQDGPNDDPERWGYGVLGLPWPMRLAEDLPVLDATVTYRGDGYAAVMGWIQVVRITVSQASESLVSQPCLGFRWGYATKAGSAAELLPLSALDVGGWHDALPLLEREFPDWTFAKEWAD